MILFYLVAIILFLFGNKYYLKNFNDNYISKNQTKIINGFFVITVVFSHFTGYFEANNIFDTALIKVMNNIGQLMVTTFFFYSGYGILESIKNKKDYLKTFAKKRFFPVWFNLAIGVTLFVIMNLVIGQKYTIVQTLFAYTGYTSIGNSNWFIFMTLLLYILVMLLFAERFLKKISLEERAGIISVIVLFMIGILGPILPGYMINTLFCFPFGMWFSLFKERFETIAKKHYWKILVLSIVAFLCMFAFKKIWSISNDFYFNIYSVLFVSIIVLLSMKVSLNNKIFEFFGDHVFWFYILQRIPMICLKGIISNTYIYFVACFCITLVMSYLMNKFSKFVLKHG